MKKLLRSIVTLKYTHLCMGLLILYGGSSLITYTSHFEKITNTFKRYCYADYNVRASLFQREIIEAEFYREKYKERLGSLFGDFFDDRDKKEVQAFFMKEGLLYDVWKEKNRNSYLLARVIERGQHKAEIPEEVVFDYFILGKKKIVPFPEYDEGREKMVFVSAGEKVAYIHRDSIDYHLSWYFDSLWESDTQSPRGFYMEWMGRKDPFTYSLYRDLQEICEYIFQKRPYRNKKEAKQYFVEEGMKIYLPTMLTMAARMIADQDSGYRSDYRYLRACLTGLSMNPNYTMVYLLRKSSPSSYNPLVRKGWDDFKQSLNINYIDEITQDQISKVCQNILEKVNNHQSIRLVRND